ncbi:G kinase-anchoring protein 1 isoform X1 [Mastacembelus armatus]|uniref:G kinase anchoring protein 1 n=1 Tax=Mastacembelus armatus TaxID=205130 RepID=A0A3Q3RIC4_9TELE|nr:G kinase-anchoring protein 1 isoform X1 [Mastacembelus armatus]XP_026178420.1 G kinase-anchoring protein 1 isoform X1 [Mastacembelus armatus]XP_026178421.1 G kinase-anchoring protein 1 isoform X1 [Mastacembelus armatus]XP_026178422.1 G kinase-anchoring protein 1 isoform X1 [Mastacembelus armatus]XP_026178423.1 G kinase-anchoring protein 1 isoform X1 [Mastacembelus armatus]
MASSAMITVPTTSSRFALLQIDSDSDSDTSDQGRATAKSLRDSSGKPRQGKAGGAGGKTPQGSDKKKDKKKKKKEQQQSEANELRNLAFRKLPQKSCAPPPCMTLSEIASDLLSPASGDHNIPADGWQQWKQRDEQITTELYEADLEKALILSKLEYEQQKQNNTNTSSPKSRGGKESGGKKDKKKNQQIKDKKTVSLQDFQAEGSVEHLSKKQDKEDSRTANPALGIGQEERFFNKLEDDVSRIIQREKRREQYANSQGQEVSTSTEHELDPRAEQLKYELEKKDQEIDKLKKTISEWEMKYKEVKARNAQLLKMLQQGEMKDKAEILLQVEELLHIKEELSSQVTLLHGALEQERSKVKGLQSEQPKHQGNKKGRKSSEMDL